MPNSSEFLGSDTSHFREEFSEAALNQAMRSELHLPEQVKECYPDLAITCRYGNRFYKQGDDGSLIACKATPGRDKGFAVIDVLPVPVWPVRVYREQRGEYFTGRQWIQLAWLSKDGELLYYTWDYKSLAEPKSCLACLSSVGYPITNGGVVSRWITDVISSPRNNIPDCACVTGYDWVPNKGVTLWHNKNLQLVTERDNRTWETSTLHLLHGDENKQYLSAAHLCGTYSVFGFCDSACLFSLIAPDMPEFVDFRPFIFLDGPANTGKSFIMRYMASQYGNPQKLIMTGNRTRNSFPAKCRKLGRIPAFFDEVMPEEHAEVVTLASGRSRGGQRQDNSEREEYTWECSIFCSGNYFIDTSKVGSRARILTVHFDSGDRRKVFPDIGEQYFRNYTANFNENHGYRASRFYSYYLQLGGMKAFRPLFDKTTGILQKTFQETPLTPKISHVLAGIIATSQMASQAFNITSEYYPLTIDLVRGFLHLDDMATTEETLDPAQEVINRLMSFLASHPNNFIENDYDKKENASVIYGKIGRTKPEGRRAVYFTLDGFEAAIKTIPNVQGSAHALALLGRTDRLYKGRGKIKRLKVESRIGKYKGPSVVLYLPDSTDDDE